MIRTLWHTVYTAQLTNQCPAGIEGLEQDSVEIERKFAKLVASVYQSLIARNISKDRLVACMMELNCLTKVYNGTNQAVFQNQRSKFEDPTATLTTVWNVIGEYFSFFYYDVLEMITDTLGTGNDKLNFAEYTKDFEAYAKRRLFIAEVKSGGPDRDIKNTDPRFHCQ